MNEEILLEDETYIDDDTSSDQGSSLEEQLDRIEALLNEDIALRQGSEPERSDQDEILVTSSGTETVSGNEAPNYSQYIYDLLLDGSVTVQVISEPEQTIFEKKLNDFSVTEAILTLGIFIALVSLGVHFIEKYVFKYRR